MLQRRVSAVAPEYPLCALLPAKYLESSQECKANFISGHTQCSNFQNGDHVPQLEVAWLVEERVKVRSSDDTGHDTETDSVDDSSSLAVFQLPLIISELS